MGSNTIKTAAVVLVILALILVFVAWRYGQSLQSSARQAQQKIAAATQQKKQQEIKVVVAAKPLGANQKITAADVKLVSVPVAPADHFSRVKQVVGRVPMLDIDAGTPLTPRLFTENNVLAHSIPDGTQALSLRVDDVVGTGGFVQPGDHVDVLVYLRPQNAGKHNTGHVQAQARVLLKDALVLAYGTRTVPPPAGLAKKKSEQNPPRRVHTAVLAVPDKDTTRVMLGASLGELRLALRGEHTPLAAAVTPAAPASVSAVASAASVPSAPASTQLGTTQSESAALPVAEVQTSAVTTGAGQSKSKMTSSKPKPPVVPDKVITLAELAGNEATPNNPKAVHRSHRRHLPPPVYIYRGDKLQSVRP